MDLEQNEDLFKDTRMILGVLVEELFDDEMFRETKYNLIKHKLHLEIDSNYLEVLEGIQEKEPVREDFLFGPLSEPRANYLKLDAEVEVLFVEIKQ